MLIARSRHAPMATSMSSLEKNAMTETWSTAISARMNAEIRIAATGFFPL